MQFPPFIVFMSSIPHPTLRSSHPNPFIPPKTWTWWWPYCRLVTIRFVTISYQQSTEKYWEVQRSTDKCRKSWESTKTRLGSKNAVSTIHCFYEQRKVLYTSPHPEIQPSSKSIYTTTVLHPSQTITTISSWYTIKVMITMIRVWAMPTL